MNKEATSRSGAGGASLLQVAFIVLELCHVIDWPWLWVLAPTWISAVLVLAVLLVAVVKR